MDTSTWEATCAPLLQDPEAKGFWRFFTEDHRRLESVPNERIWTLLREGSRVVLTNGRILGTRLGWVACRKPSYALPGGVRLLIEDPAPWFAIGVPFGLHNLREGDIVHYGGAPCRIVRLRKREFGYVLEGDSSQAPRWAPYEEIVRLLVRTEVHVSHEPPFDAPEFYPEGVMATIRGPRGSFEVVNEGRRDVTHRGETLRSWTSFRAAFPRGRLPEEGETEETVWHNNGWFNILSLDDPAAEGEVTYDLFSALAEALRLALEGDNTQGRGA